MTSRTYLEILLHGWLADLLLEKPTQLFGILGISMEASMRLSSPHDSVGYFRESVNRISKRTLAFG